MAAQSQAPFNNIQHGSVLREYEGLGLWIFFTHDLDGLEAGFDLRDGRRVRWDPSPRPPRWLNLGGRAPFAQIHALQDGLAAEARAAAGEVHARDAADRLAAHRALIRRLAQLLDALGARADLSLDQ